MSRRIEQACQGCQSHVVSNSQQQLYFATSQHACFVSVQPGDEREVKRLKRKQSNRESARRSRMKKQAECENLGESVKILSVSCAVRFALLTQIP